MERRVCFTSSASGKLVCAPPIATWNQLRLPAGAFPSRTSKPERRKSGGGVSLGIRECLNPHARRHREVPANLSMEMRATKGRGTRWRGCQAYEARGATGRRRPRHRPDGAREDASWSSARFPRNSSLSDSMRCTVCASGLLRRNPEFASAIAWIATRVPALFGGRGTLKRTTPRELANRETEATNGGRTPRQGPGGARQGPGPRPRVENRNSAPAPGTSPSSSSVVDCPSTRKGRGRVSRCASATCARSRHARKRRARGFDMARFISVGAGEVRRAGHDHSPQRELTPPRRGVSRSLPSMASPRLFFARMMPLESMM